ncbi:MAG: hypothetical protein PHS41_08855 [Victivallaceae bacterium]|nr:hypothetical protein [Victivallaceae bacterium]
MKRFIKNNLILILMMGISLVLAIFLLILAALQHSEMKDYIQQTEQMRGEIQSLINEKPAAVEGNMQLLQKDQQLYEAKTRELSSYFVSPYRRALESFATALGEKDCDAFVKKFQDFWSKNKNNPAGKSFILDDFKNKNQYTGKWKNALQSFLHFAQPNAVEPLGTQSDAFLLAQMGVPRDMDGDGNQALARIRSVQNELDRIYRQNKVILNNAAEGFGFSRSTPPAFAEIVPTLKALEVAGDLGRRVASAKVDALETFQLLSLTPRNIGQFQSYCFAVGVRGDIAGIRSLVKILNEAFRQNRIYIVQSVVFLRNSNQAAAIFTGAGETAEKSRVAAMPSPSEAVRMDDPNSSRDQAKIAAAARAKAEAEREAQMEAERKKAEAALPYNKRSSYGVPLIGADNKIRAKFLIEYIMPTTNDIAK